MRPRVLLLVGGLFLLLGAAQLLVLRGVLYPGFVELEGNAARTDMQRVAHTVARELELLQSMTDDWGNWDATYGYMQDHDPAFITQNMTLSAIQGYRANAVALVDRSGKYLWSTAIAPGSGEPLDLDLIAAGRLPDGAFWQRALREGSSVHGLVGTSQGPMLVALAPVLNGDGKGPFRGLVLLGRLLTAAEIARIGTQAQVTLAMPVVRPAGVAVPAALRTPPAGEPALEVHASATQVRQAFSDVGGAPLLLLQIDVPRTISAHGRRVIGYVALFLLGTGAILVALLLWLLNRSILDPLARMTRHVVAIGRSDDLDARLALARRDELGELAREFDHMLGQLAQARRQLIDQSFDAGIAENASGVLHNLGNAMTPLAVRAAALQERLRAAPAGDVELVLAELARCTPDPARRADLDHFLQLASRDLALATTEARHDAGQLARQVQEIQQVLAAQHDQARAQRVMETVRLEELLHAAAALVPPALGRRLAIEADASLAALAPVRVARTLLLQVFQNLIVNAAEAVRDSGRERGLLRVSARIDATADGERLELRFADDGVGIGSADLARIFDKGYTTKPAHGNSGIGLHWCANTVTALGGRMRAESAGAQHGASLYVVLPVPHPVATPLSRVA
ncbi:MAG: CHASE4 domain-containing protein [Steroidobacteraceae bacterium]